MISVKNSSKCLKNSQSYTSLFLENWRAVNTSQAVKLMKKYYPDDKMRLIQYEKERKENGRPLISSWI